MAYQQPVRGYRTGIEPVFLAAAVPARPGERVLEAGTGAGAALLCLAARVPGVVGVGVERDAAMATLARCNMAPFANLSVFEGAVEQLGELPPFDHAPFDHAGANPPWHDPAGTAPPDPVRRGALHAPAGALALWCRVLAGRLRPGGTLTLVLAARLAGEGAACLRAAGAGRVLTRPLLPKEGRAPKIVLLHAVAGSDAPGHTLPGLVLHRAEGGYTAEAEAVLRDGAALSWQGSWEE